MDNIVSIKNLTKSYGQTQALKNVNLDLTSGKIIGLLGPNGSGKTTLIKILTGLLQQYEGSVTIDGKLLGPETKAIVSYLPDQLYFDSWMKINDLKNYFMDMYEDFSPVRFNELIYQFQIPSRDLIRKLSKGNQEKLQLALVLSRDAKLYIFDEPIGGVDPALREIILETIMNYRNSDATILLSTHQIYDVEDLFDEVIFLKQGEVMLHQNLDELIMEKNKSLLEIFKEVFRYAR
ncbi:ABC transporter ATP-binding protein [Acholeplasma manati]|uniref:ABC transporter ATP-binding protein n=1 Tax=Paracholeplasma manati TaxID=591373 RepID=A0ABT2Y525_9MOLU|nr:ABC transporter ATP-binding protein [Paracholeplasma manati]MCV2231847.1 ABC transporter ATP-binding protein [Paracholeplasma manati]